LSFPSLLPMAALPFPEIDPVLVQIGPLAIHWYGLAYVVGIVFAWWYAKRLVSNPRLWPEGVLPMKSQDIDDFVISPIRPISSRYGRAACRSTAALWAPR
jgi:phosphatidylglycerol:prolipoprotein diacylglycerol transferase